jgi:hypothetical protein
MKRLYPILAEFVKGETHHGTGSIIIVLSNGQIFLIPLDPTRPDYLVFPYAEAAPYFDAIMNSGKPESTLLKELYSRDRVCSTSRTPLKCLLTFTPCDFIPLKAEYENSRRFLIISGLVY